MRAVLRRALTQAEREGLLVAALVDLRRRGDDDPGDERRTPLVVGELKTRRARQVEQRLAPGEEYRDHDLVFATETGTPLDPDNFSHAFSRICRKAGLGHWHVHELRHSGASLMLAQGTDLYVVSEVLGHSSIAITKDVYDHLVEDHQREAATAMTRALFGESS